VCHFCICHGSVAIALVCALYGLSNHVSIGSDSQHAFVSFCATVSDPKLRIPRACSRGPKGDVALSGMTELSSLLQLKQVIAAATGIPLKKLQCMPIGCTRYLTSSFFALAVPSFKSNGMCVHIDSSVVVPPQGHRWA